MELQEIRESMVREEPQDKLVMLVIRSVMCYGLDAYIHVVLCTCTYK